MIVKVNFGVQVKCAVKVIGLKSPECHHNKVKISASDD